MNLIYEDAPAIDDPVAESQTDDARGVVIYLVSPGSTQYIAIMDVLESSITDLAPRDVGTRLLAAGLPIPESVVEERLDKLREWGAVSARTDTSRILRHADLLARNWRYTATPTGRQVQRFYRKFLAGTPIVREIPLSSLARVLEAAGALVSIQPSDSSIADLVGRLFVNHDDLDAALVGAEDSLTGLADRFDLDHESTAELKALLVGYATHVAAELERGSARVFRALNTLLPRFQELANAAVRASDARVLIERGALSASHGGRMEDWEGLLGWFNPISGRSARFALKLVRALPGMHVNLRRLHSSSGMVTSRSRALALAKACTDPTYGMAVLLASLGDHPWRKLYGAADDADMTRIKPWFHPESPRVEVPELLRLTGRNGPRGRVAASKDDSATRVIVQLAREQRMKDHAAAIREVLAAELGACVFSERAARVALASLMAAARADGSRGRRTAACDGLGCTLFHTGIGFGIVETRTWRVLTPGRIPVFHLPGVVPTLSASAPLSEERERPTMILARGIA